MSTSARALAVRILRDIERREGFSNRILDEHLKANPSLDGRDRGFVTTLVYGVLRHRGRLDHQLDTAATKPQALKGELRTILRIGAYELLELGHRPAVACDEAAKLTHKISPGGRLRGLVTAVLSNIDRNGAQLDFASESAAPIDALEHRWSVPRWLAGKWIKQRGSDAALAEGRAYSEPPPLDLRVDLGRISRHEVRDQIASRVPDAELEAPAEYPHALRVRRGRGGVLADPLHTEGLFSVQGLASQAAALALAPRAGERILDACAGMGVKTLQMAELMQHRGSIVAVDPEGMRLAQLEELRPRIVGPQSELTLTVLEGDARQPQKILESQSDDGFDAVLVDTPCTGLGNLARHPELRWTARYEDIADRASLQEELLVSCLSLVRPGGRLVYSVCSGEPEEGPALIERVLGLTGATRITEQAFGPVSLGTDGFYVATLAPPAPR